MRWTDRILGVLLGIVLGVGVVVVFVFVYSEQTVDAPSISDGGNRGDRNRHQIPQKPGLGGRPTLEATVRIVGGAPPPSGPVQLHYKKGDEINLHLVSDGTVRLQALGLGVSTTVYAGQPSGLQFKASKTGDFPLVVAASHIDVARIAITGD